MLPIGPGLKLIYVEFTYLSIIERWILYRVILFFLYVGLLCRNQLENVEMSTEN